jgi:uncharacterized protein
MAQRTDLFDLERLGLTSGEGRRLDLHVHVDPFDYGGSRYAVDPQLENCAGCRALRLRFSAELDGPCMRCLEDASPVFDVDAYEVHQPGLGDELASPYVRDELDLEAWARDALALALPAQLTCRDECAGLCPECGANLNEDPEHAHERAPSPRWAKLSELKFE